MNEAQRTGADDAPDEPDVSLIRLPHTLSDEQAARPAFVGPGPRTYGELLAGVAATASGLRAAGAEVGDRVAVWMDKRPRYAEAVLAALRAGCAYVPLDGGQPPGRVETILADAEPVAVFTDRRHLAALDGRALPASVRAVVVTGDGPDGGGGEEPLTALGGVPVQSWADFTAAYAQAGAQAHAGAPAGSAVAPPAPVERDDLAAILYTSGSTGTPKGVRISYRNLANFIRWARGELSVGPDDVFANHASFNFDLSTFDLFTALSVGASVWIVADDQARDVAALAAGIREHAVTVWYSVPSVLNLLAVSGALTAESAASLRYVLFAGEVFPVPQLRALAGLLPERAALYNLYGPTETNVCTYHRVRPQDLARGEPVPIGTPVPGARVSVVDGDGRDAEGADVLGELVVEGDCVTPGYWRRELESKTAGHGEGRHATGDLVSLEGGSLVYRGRKDRMVKLSGYRVELGEIEAAVLRHPAVEAAAVVVNVRGTDARIALYYTLRSGARRPNLIEIKRHCAQHLPKYMLPQTATCLDELPHNANGKTDYQRLGGGSAEPVQRPRALPGK